MFRRLVLAGLLVTVVGFGVAVQPAAAAESGQQAEGNATAFDVTFPGGEIYSGYSTRLNVSGIEPGTTVEITSASFSHSTLIEMFDGEPTVDGIRVSVPPNGSIPVDAPPICEIGGFGVTVQKLDTGRRATADVMVTASRAVTIDFARPNYSVIPGGVVPVTIETNCQDVQVWLDDTDSDYRASIAVEDDGERNHTVWIDTTRPLNASGLFTAEVDANVTVRNRSGYLSELNGTYRLLVGEPNSPLRSANLTISPDGRYDQRVAAETISVDPESDEFATNDEDDWIRLGFDGIWSWTPLAAHLAGPQPGYPETTVAKMLGGEVVDGNVRTQVFENGTLMVSAIPEIRCWSGDLSLRFQRRDTGQTARATVAAVEQDVAGASFRRTNYTVPSGDALPISLSRECHEVSVELHPLERPNESASITLAEDGPIERNETLWLDTASPANATDLFRPELGTATRNRSSNLSGNGSLAPGTYSLELTYVGGTMDETTLTVTNRSDTNRSSEPVEDPPEMSPEPTPSASDKAVSPTTAPPTTGPLPTVSTPDPATSAATPSQSDSPRATQRTTGGSGPGFGPVLALVAFAAVARLAWQRRTR